jgi:hypothetical protein
VLDNKSRFNTTHTGDLVKGDMVKGTRRDTTLSFKKHVLFLFACFALWNISFMYTQQQQQKHFQMMMNIFETICLLLFSVNIMKVEIPIKT